MKKIALLFLVLISTYIFLVLFLLIKFHPWNTIGEIGQFGDFFGVLNCLFSGLALIAVVFTLFYQKEELRLQRLEIEKNREELKEQSEIQRNQLEQSQKLNDFKILATCYGFLGQENDNCSRKIKLLNDNFFKNEKEEQELNELVELLNINHCKAMEINEIFKSQTGIIIKKLGN